MNTRPKSKKRRGKGPAAPDLIGEGLEVKIDRENDPEASDGSSGRRPPAPLPADLLIAKRSKRRGAPPEYDRRNDDQKRRSYVRKMDASHAPRPVN